MRLFPGRVGWLAARLACGVFAVAAASGATLQNDAGLVAQMKLREAAVPLREMPDWHSPKKIVVVVDSDARLEWLRQATAGSTTLLVPARTPGELLQRVVDADAMVGPCIAEVIDAGTHLRWIQASVAGAESCLTLAPIRDGKVILTNMQRANAVTVSEHAMAMVLALSRDLVPLISAQREGRWIANAPSNMVGLEGKTMLIIGLGGVGSELAQRAHAFGMHVIATRYSGHEGPTFVEHIGTPSELSSMVGQADFIVNCTPLTPETTKMIDARLFERMRPTAYLINVGRGRSVVTDDLVNALRSARIAGAALDVVDPEPLPKDHPLWRMPNVLITPHLADNSEGKTERSWILMRENLRRYVRGGKLLSVVDIKRGY